MEPKLVSKVNLSRAPSSAARLEAFAEAQIGAIRRQLGTAPIAPWPGIQGCLAILFTSRSGSTFLARRLECVFEIGRLRESLNSSRVWRTSAAEIVASRRDPWFSFKAGPDGLIAAELCGFVDVYLRQTSFILLLRRDVVAQAVSGVKARQTGRWHSTQKAAAATAYDGAKISEYVSLVTNAVERLRTYIARAGRPWRTLIYEDFANGDFTNAFAACDDLGVPRRGAGSRIRPMPVERIGDSTNEAWASRFRQEMDAQTRDRVEGYSAGI